jgi:hypothetical protein
MSDNMNDEKFEEFLQREAKEYNAPPSEVPRDEMFAAITVRRKLEAGSRMSEDRGPKIENRVRSLRFAWIGMAATLLIGVAIGKFALSRQEAAAPVLTASQSNLSVPLSHTDTTSYARAATAELSRAEALLTAYSASGANAAVDAQLSGWARDILSNTRLLLDSPAAVDPSRRKLLQDLELVLVQMVQRSPEAGASEERAHIDRSLERTQVLTRLRSTLPAARNN